MSRATVLVGFSFFVLATFGCRTISEPDPRIEDSYVHVRPAWSPDGTTIAFTNAAPGAQGIYTVDTSEGSMTLVHAGEGIGLTWSPDSRWIAFSALRRIYKIQPSGDSLMLAAQTTNDIRPAWSPDGTRIAYVNNGIKMVTLPTGAITSLVAVGDYPSWKGSDEVVFLTASAPGSYQIRSYRLSAQEEQLIHLFTVTADVWLTTVNPAGTAVAYAAQHFHQTDYAQVLVYSLVSQTTTQLTNDGGDHPAWSPDGSQIVYVRPVKGDGGLWIMNADGTGKRRLTQP